MGRRRRPRQVTNRMHNGRPLNGGPNDLCTTIVPQDTRLIDSSAETFPRSLHDYGYGGPGGFGGGAEIGELEAWDGTHNSFRVVPSTDSAVANTTINTNGLTEHQNFGTLENHSTTPSHDEKSCTLNDEVGLLVNKPMLAKT